MGKNTGQLVGRRGATLLSTNSQALLSKPGTKKATNLPTCHMMGMRNWDILSYHPFHCCSS